MTHYRTVFILRALLVFISLICPLQRQLWAAEEDIENRFIYNGDYRKKISMDFKDASLLDVLKIFSKESGMNFISAGDVSNKKITLFIDNIPVEEALEKILDANDLTYEMAPNSDVFIVKPKPKEQTITRVYPLKYAAVTGSKLGGSKGKGSENATGGISSAVKAVLSPGGKLEEDARTNSFIVTDIAQQFPLIEETINKLDISVVQILIQVEMLDVSKGASDKLGINYGNGGPFVQLTGASRASTFPFDEHLIARKTGTNPITWTPADAGYDFTGMTAALDFLKSQNDSHILARPRLLTLNNQTANIEVTTNEAIGLKVSTNNSSTTASNTTQEAERTKTGVSLEVTPQANVITGEIILSVTPKVSSAKQGATFGGQSFKDPEEQSSTSILKVKNGETIIIGGLLRTQENSASSNLPFLGDMPLVGAAFRHKTKDSSERELIIFITPYILDDKVKQKLDQDPTTHINRELSQFEMKKGH